VRASHSFPSLRSNHLSSRIPLMGERFNPGGAL
jgi:hypothetical protein